MQANQQRREFFIKKTKLTESQSKQNPSIKTTIDVEDIKAYFVKIVLCSLKDIQF